MNSIGSCDLRKGLNVIIYLMYACVCIFIDMVVMIDGARLISSAITGIQCCFSIYMFVVLNDFDAFQLKNALPRKF